MAKIEECVNQRIKISKNSITIKGEDGTTCGVVRNICSLHDLQLNKQFEFCSHIRKMGLQGKVDLNKCIIFENNLYVFRNMKSKLFQEKHGFFDGYEKQQAEEDEFIYETLKDNGIYVVEYIPA